MNVAWVLTGVSSGYNRVPKGAKVVSIDGKHVTGTCDICRSVIPIGAHFFTWSDKIITCEKCGGPSWNDIELGRRISTPILTGLSMGI